MIENNNIKKTKTEKHEIIKLLNQLIKIWLQKGKQEFNFFKIKKK